MAKKRVADVLVDTLVAADVKRVYGLVGDLQFRCQGW
jgi:thiamine pyrophosphate-dependent acetolactate synthase large subunit-like protein